MNARQEEAQEIVHGWNFFECQLYCMCGWKTKKYETFEEAAFALRKHLHSRKQSRSAVIERKTRRRSLKED